MKTAVEWLNNEIECISLQLFDGFLTFNEFIEQREALFKQAKKMEKEQMGYPKAKVDKLIDALYKNNMCSIAGDELIETFKSE